MFSFSLSLRPSPVITHISGGFEVRRNAAPGTVCVHSYIPARREKVGQREKQTDGYKKERSGGAGLYIHACCVYTRVFGLFFPRRQVTDDNERRGEGGPAACRRPLPPVDHGWNSAHRQFKGAESRKKKRKKPCAHQQERTRPSASSAHRGPEGACQKYKNGTSYAAFSQRDVRNVDLHDVAFLFRGSRRKPSSGDIQRIGFKRE